MCRSGTGSWFCFLTFISWTRTFMPGLFNVMQVVAGSRLFLNSFTGTLVLSLAANFILFHHFSWVTAAIDFLWSANKRCLFSQNMAKIEFTTYTYIHTYVHTHTHTHTDTHAHTQHVYLLYVKGEKVQFNLEQASKAQRGCRCIAVLFL